ncbi:hypothetical protein ACROYT_G029257 [Oculina patagonica]
MATSRILSGLVFFAVITGLKAQEPLSVTDYGSLQISMVRHGEKYATNRDCYSYEDVSPLYHGMTHVRGLNDKNGKITFKVDVPVIIYLAVDSRYPYIHGDDYEATGDLVMLGGCHKRTKFPIYRSRRVHGPGLVTVDFTSSRMTGIFLRDNAYEVRPYAELKVTFPGTPREISMVRDGEKFSTNRACYAMVDIPPKYHGLTHLRGPNDETTITFHVNIPVLVYVAIDSRNNANAILPAVFKATGEKIVHGGCHARTDFPIYERKYPSGGTVTIPLLASRMLTIMVKPLM